VVVFDDMVRTGSTIVNCCSVLRQARPRRVIFGVSHFYSSAEGRENMASPAVDEILTTNTLPTILNRDTQGRLRKKMVVIKIEKWIARFLLRYFGEDTKRPRAGLLRHRHVVQESSLEGRRRLLSS
jgi:ribose-phosphate pyrophosphokinase